MTHPIFSTFIPVSGDPEHKKFVLDIDSIQCDWGLLDGDADSILFPDGTPAVVVREFLEMVIIPEVGGFSFESVACVEDSSCVYASIYPPLPPEIRDEVEDLIIDLSNSLRSSNRNA